MTGKRKYDTIIQTIKGHHDDSMIKLLDIFQEIKRNMEYVKQATGHANKDKSEITLEDALSLINTKK